MGKAVFLLFSYVSRHFVGEHVVSAAAQEATSGFQRRRIDSNTSESPLDWLPIIGLLIQKKKKKKKKKRNCALQSIVHAESATAQKGTFGFLRRRADSSADENCFRKCTWSCSPKRKEEGKQTKRLQIVKLHEPKKI